MILPVISQCSDIFLLFTRQKVCYKTFFTYIRVPSYVHEFSLVTSRTKQRKVSIRARTGYIFFSYGNIEKALFVACHVRSYTICQPLPQDNYLFVVSNNIRTIFASWESFRNLFARRQLLCYFPQRYFFSSFYSTLSCFSKRNGRNFGFVKIFLYFYLSFCMVVEYFYATFTFYKQEKNMLFVKSFLIMRLYFEYACFATLNKNQLQ